MIFTNSDNALLLWFVIWRKTKAKVLLIFSSLLWNLRMWFHNSCNAMKVKAWLVMLLVVGFKFFENLNINIIYSMNHCVKTVQIRRFFLSVFSRICSEYWDLLRKSPYSETSLQRTSRGPQKSVCCREVSVT